MIKQLIFIGVVLLFSCNPKTETVDDKLKKDTIPVVQKSFTKTVFLSESARKEIVNLKNFEEFEKIMDKFYNFKPAEITVKTTDLNEVLVRLKDSITIEKINRPDVKARFNILHNESLRLLDMSTINTITQEEINHKIENIIYAYESIITKINQVYFINENEENVDVQFQAPKVFIDSLPKELIIPPQKSKQLNQIKAK